MYLEVWPVSAGDDPFNLVSSTR